MARPRVKQEGCRSEQQPIPHNCTKSCTFYCITTPNKLASLCPTVLLKYTSNLTISSSNTKCSAVRCYPEAFRQFHKFIHLLYQ
eukprot:scaffold193077_cov21-Tisochrysis_lutea.AAC.2